MEELVKRGHEVYVITGIPNYPTGNIYNGYTGGSWIEETINGVKIIRCPIVPRGKTIGKLFVNYISYMYLGTKACKRLVGEFDVCFCYQLTPITQLYPAIKYKNKKKIPLVSYNLDLAPMSGSAKIGHFIMEPYTKFSKWAMNSCDKVLVTSESFIEYNNTINQVPIEKMEYLPQHASDELLNINMESKDNGIFDFMFAGNVGWGIRHQVMVNAAKTLVKKQDNFLIHIVGDGSALESFENDVHKEGLDDKFVFWGRQSREKMPEFYSKADALLITLRKDQTTVPGKLQTYMTTGKPIFGAMDGSGSKVISDAKCGVCVQAEDSKGLAEVMLSYMRNEQAYVNCGKNGKDFFEKNFTLKRFMDRFESILEEISVAMSRELI